MDVSLTPEWQQFVDDALKTGLYGSPSEVISAGLRRLKEDGRAVPPTTIAELEAQLVKSAERFDRGEGVSGEEVHARLRDRIRTARASA